MNLDPKIVHQAREEMRQWLVKYTHCKAHDGYIGHEMHDASWPCGTCVMAFLSELGLTDEDEQYHVHNAAIDRLNEVWRAILQIRETDLNAREEELVHESE
jgi:hypothetical protein